MLRISFAVIILTATALAQTPQQAELASLHPRIAEFITDWLVQRNAPHTLAFIDDSAYKDKPVFGEGCEGWQHRGMSLEKARQTVGNYLSSTANSYPAGTDFRQMLVNLSSAEWAAYSINDVAADRYIVMRIDENSLKGMFGKNKHPYRDVLTHHLKNGSPLYWSVFGILLPDHNALVVYAAWQRVRNDWYITAIDVTCPGI